MSNTFEMAEIEDVHRNFEMLSLNDVLMAASEVQFYPAPYLRKVWLMIKADASLREYPLDVTSRSSWHPALETLLIRDVREGTQVVCAGQLCCESRSGV